jgi:N-acyl-D-amino-acid deacylase
MRDEGSHSVGLFVALNEAIEIGRRTGIRVQISHVKCSGPAVWGRAGDVLDLFDRTRREGIDLAGDQYPYTAASTSLTGALFPRWSLEGGREATLKRLASAAERRRLHTDIAAMFAKWSTAEGVVIARFVPDPRLEGQNMVQVAETLRCDAAEATLRLYGQGEASVVVHAMQEADVEIIARHPWIAVGSDGSSLSAHGMLAVGKPHPRSYGTNPRYLARFVRQRGLVALPEAVRKMTLLPATRLGLTRRGRIAPGFAADLVVFDPETVADTATFEMPHSYPIGIPHVAVNGVLVIENGDFTGQTPGKVVRGFDD